MAKNYKEIKSRTERQPEADRWLWTIHKVGGIYKFILQVGVTDFSPPTAQKNIHNDNEYHYEFVATGQWSKSYFEKAFTP